jgi:hypothetical protein
VANHDAVSKTQLPVEARIRLIAVPGCAYSRVQQEELSNFWHTGLLRATSLTSASPVCDIDFACVSFADLLVPPRVADQGKYLGLGNNGLLYVARQVCNYISDSACRRAIQDRVTGRIGAVSTVIVAHSLGSVAAYEALSAMPAHNVYTLITLGSPLGLRHMFFNRLRTPTVAGRHSWPAPLAQWVNISFSRDPVAFVNRLSPLFGNGRQITDIILRGRSNSHSLQSYLAAPETCSVVASALHGMRKRSG